VITVFASLLMTILRELLVISGQDNSNKSCSAKQELDIYET